MRQSWASQPTVAPLAVLRVEFLFTFGPRKLGRLHERHTRIEDEYGRLKRHKV